MRCLKFILNFILHVGTLNFDIHCQLGRFSTEMNWEDVKSGECNGAETLSREMWTHHRINTHGIWGA